MPDFEFPHHRKLLAETVLIERLKLDDMWRLRGPLVGGAAWQALNLDIGNRPCRAAHLNDLARFRKDRHSELVASWSLVSEHCSL